jgi:hypothetical protein
MIAFYAFFFVAAILAARSGWRRGSLVRGMFLSALAVLGGCTSGGPDGTGGSTSSSTSDEAGAGGGSLCGVESGADTSPCTLDICSADRTAENPCVTNEGYALTHGECCVLEGGLGTCVSYDPVLGPMFPKCITTL